MATVHVPLTQGKFATIDIEDWPRVSQFKWHASRHRSGNWYARKKCVHADGRIGVYGLHQFILGLAPGTLVDHVDGEGLNNTRQNLRPATPGQNRTNTGAQRNNKVGYKGVTKRGRYDRWQASIGCQGKRYFLGRFTTPEAAARAYDAKARELFGPFAHCNFPEQLSD